MVLNSSKLSRKKLLVFVMFAAVFALQVWKAFRGMGSADEHFYTTLGFRFAGSDRIFADDWHIAQMISFFLDPVVSLYLRFTGGTEGILLFMRLVYVFCLLTTGYVLYLRFESHGFRAVIAALIYLLYTPFQIMALSYNTMSVMFVILAISAYPDESEEKLRLFFAGLNMAFAVINTPYLALFYVFLTILAIVKPALFSRKRWVFMSLGVLAAAIVFLSYVFAMTPPALMMASLRHLIDPSHSGGIRQIARNTALLWRFFHIFFPLMVLEAAAAFYVRTKETEIRRRYMDAVLILSLCAMGYAGIVNSWQENLGGHGTLLLPFAAAGMVYLILYREKSYPAAVFFISVFHAVMILCSSNVGPRTFIAPLILACSMSVLLIRVNRRPTLSMACAVLLVSLLYGKIEDVYDGSGTYTTSLAAGPLKGLRDSPENAESYERSLADLRTINARSERNAMLVTWNCWEYLALNKTIATFSTYPYFWQEEEYLRAQKEYMLEHPDRFPALVYLDHTAAPYDMKDSDPWLLDMKKEGDLRNGTLFILED